MKFTPLHRLALRIALLVVAVIGVITLLVYIFRPLSVLSISILILTGFLLIYFMVKNGYQKFIFDRISKVYESSLFQNELLIKNQVKDLDLDTLIEKIRSFAETKHSEIEKLHNRDDFRKEFLGDVSHELKTPLFTAQGYLLTVLDEDFEDKELERKYLERTQKSIERLAYIVKDLDLISKLESGMSLEQSNFNIVKVIKDVLDILEFRANQKGINFAFDEAYDYPIAVKADRKKIEQVLINLITNSINYGKVGGTTLISINTFTDSRISVEVRDNGIGIESKHIPRLFERFFRVDKSRSRVQGSSGLGLAIVKHIIEAHDQEIMVKSTPGKGSSFLFTLNKVI